MRAAIAALQYEHPKLSVKYSRLRSSALAGLVGIASTFRFSLHGSTIFKCDFISKSPDVGDRLTE
jgi:hypothetical protein